MLLSKIKYIKALGVRCNSSHYVTTPIFYVNAGQQIEWLNNN